MIQMKEKRNTIVLLKPYITVVKQPYTPKRHTNRKGCITKWV